LFASSGELAVPDSDSRVKLRLAFPSEASKTSLGLVSHHSIQTCRQVASPHQWLPCIVIESLHTWTLAGHSVWLLKHNLTLSFTLLVHSQHFVCFGGYQRSHYDMNKVWFANSGNAQVYGRALAYWAPRKAQLGVPAFLGRPRRAEMLVSSVPLPCRLLPCVWL
jgi:hypothetical protein